MCNKRPLFILNNGLLNINQIVSLNKGLSYSLDASIKTRRIHTLILKITHLIIKAMHIPINTPLIDLLSKNPIAAPIMPYMM